MIASMLTIWACCVASCSRRPVTISTGALETKFSLDSLLSLMAMSFLSCSACFPLAGELGVFVDEAFEGDVAVGVAKGEAGGGRRADDARARGSEDRFGEIVELARDVLQIAGDVVAGAHEQLDGGGGRDVVDREASRTAMMVLLQAGEAHFRGPRPARPLGGRASER